MIDPQVMQGQMAQMEWARQNAREKRDLQQQQMLSSQDDRAENVNLQAQQAGQEQTVGAPQGQERSVNQIRQEQLQKKEEKKKSQETATTKAKKEKSDAIISGKDILAVLIAVMLDFYDVAADTISGTLTTLIGAVSTVLAPVLAPLLAGLVGLIASIPIIGQVVVAAGAGITAAFFGGMGLGAEFISIGIKIPFWIIIYVLIGKRMPPWMKIAFFGMSIVDMFPFIRDLPAETASVVATIMISMVTKTVKKVTPVINKAKMAKRRAGQLGSAFKKAGKVIAAAV